MSFRRPLPRPSGLFPEKAGRKSGENFVEIPMDFRVDFWMEIWIEILTDFPRRGCVRVVSVVKS